MFWDVFPDLSGGEGFWGGWGELQFALTRSETDLVPIYLMSSLADPIYDFLVFGVFLLTWSLVVFVGFLSVAGIVAGRVIRCTHYPILL